MGQFFAARSKVEQGSGIIFRTCECLEVSFSLRIVLSFKEKAGREGFIVNGACRALKFWLEDVFVDIADRCLGRKADRDDKRKLREEKAKAAALARIEREKAEYLKQIRYARGWLNDFSKVTNAAVAQSRECLSRAANAAAGKGLPECEEAIDKLRTLLGELQASVSDPPNGVAIIGDALDVITD